MALSMAALMYIKLLAIILLLTALGLGFDSYNPAEPSMQRDKPPPIGTTGIDGGGPVDPSGSSFGPKITLVGAVGTIRGTYNAQIDFACKEKDDKKTARSSNIKEQDIPAPPAPTNSTPSNSTSPQSKKQALAVLKSLGSINFQAIGGLDNIEMSKEQKCTKANNDHFLHLGRYDLHRVFLFIVAFLILFTPFQVFYDIFYKEMTMLHKLIDVIAHGLAAVLLIIAGLCLLGKAIKTDIIVQDLWYPKDIKGKNLQKLSEPMTKKYNSDLAIQREQDAMAEIIIAGLFGVLAAAANIIAGIGGMMIPTEGKPSRTVPPSIRPSAMTQSPSQYQRYQEQLAANGGTMPMPMPPAEQPTA